MLALFCDALHRKKNNLHQQHMETFSKSSFPGFKTHLPTVNVTLPLKYPDVDIATLTPNESFNNELSESGNLIDVSSATTLLDFISYDLLNDHKTITFVPVIFKNNFNLKYHNIKISLPHPIISRVCLNVNYHSDSLIIDLIDSNYLFITIKIALSNFERSRLTLDNLADWCHISVPYSFELRSAPYYIKSIDKLNILVSLKDGGLLHLQRQHELDEFDVYLFNEASSLIPLNFISGLFKKKNNPTVLDGVSSNSLVDVVKLDDDNFVALTVNKLLKFWNLKSHQQILNPIDLNDFNVELSSSWLNTIPVKYLHLFTIGERILLTLYVNSARNREDNNRENSSGFVFKTWEIHNADMFQVEELENLFFEPELPSMFAKHAAMQNHLWFIQDYQVELEDNELRYYVLWKSNTSSILVVYVVNVENGSMKVRNWSRVQELSTTFSPRFDISKYQNQVLNSSRYDELIVRTSLNIIKTHLGVDISQAKSIRESINEIAPFQPDQKLFWFNLFSLCEEYKKSSEESIAMVLTPSYVLTLQSNGLGALRPSHMYESFGHQEEVEVNLASILKKVQNLLSTKTYQKITEIISHQQNLTEPEVTEIFDTCLRSKISRDSIVSIVLELDSLPNVLDEINSLIDTTEDFELIDIEEDTPENIALVTTLNTLAAFKEIKHQHVSILNNLVILLIICDVNQHTLPIVNVILEKLKTYNLISYVFDTSFNSLELSAGIETRNLNQLENSLFWPSIVHQHPHLRFLIQESKVNEAYDYFYSVISISSNFIVDVVINLINRGEGELVKKAFLSNLRTGNVIDRFLIGLTYLITNDPDQFYSTFQDYKFFDFSKSVQSTLHGLSKFTTFLDSIFAASSSDLLHEANYFHSLSELSQFQAKHAGQKSFKKTNEVEIEFTNIALKFESKAIENLKQTKGLKILIDSYYLNIFELSVNLTNYDLIYDTLSNLYVTVSPPHYDYTALFTRFINKLVINKDIPILFAPNQNKLYHKNYLRIDKILLELAKNEAVLSNSLRFYEYVYAWRLFGAANRLSSKELVDKRGAIEALYMFIARFKTEKSLIQYTEKNIEDLKQYKLKILELYMIILNCLRSFDDDEDKWILIKDGKLLKVAQLDDIKIEHYEWLKELESEMMEI